jgi:hypothetical protein
LFCYNFMLLIYLFVFLSYFIWAACCFVNMSSKPILFTPF